MNQETPISDDRGNSVGLREYIERILTEKEKALAVALDAQQRALELRESNLDNRLEKLNELRREVTEDRAKFVSVEKYDVEIGGLKEFRSRALGFGALLALLSGAVGAAIAEAITG